MAKSDIIKRIERLEENSHPPVSWKSKIDNIVKRIDELTRLYGEIIHKLIKQRKQNFKK